MSIMIDKSKCIGCGKCCMVCPGSLIKKDGDNKAFIKYPKDCWGCTSCIKECPMHAISFYLGADIGGMGSKVHTRGKRSNILKWVIEKYERHGFRNRHRQKESNKY